MGVPVTCSCLLHRIERYDVKKSIHCPKWNERFVTNGDVLDTLVRCPDWMIWRYQRSTISNDTTRYQVE